MTLVTPHFHVEEFDCKDQTPFPAEWVATRLKPLCDALEVIREKCGNNPVLITSGYRTPTWNIVVGGADDSRHMQGDAADFMIPGVLATHVYEVCLTLQEVGLIDCGGVSIYKQRVPFVHIDIRGRRVRWEGSVTQVPL